MKLKNRSNFLDGYLILNTFDTLFTLVCVTNYPISWQLLIGIILGYPMIGQSDTV